MAQGFTLLDLPKYAVPQPLDLSPLQQAIQFAARQQQAAIENERAQQQLKLAQNRDTREGEMAPVQRASLEANTQSSLGSESRAQRMLTGQLEAQRAGIESTRATTGLTQAQADAARIKVDEAKNPAIAYERRAQMAAQYGLKPGTREHNEFVLTGDFPRGQSGTALQFQEREKAAAQYGLAPGTPAYQAFVLTGKMPREDQQPLTATDKKAILEADEMVLSSEGVIKNLEDAKALSKQAYTGPTAATRGYITSFAGSEGGRATEELRTLITQNALQQLKATFGAAPTEGERKILLEIQGAVDKEPKVREAIFDRASQLAEKRLAFYRKRAEEMRGGGYFKAPAPAAAPGSAPATDLKSKYGLE